MKTEITQVKQFIANESAKLTAKTVGYLGVEYEDYDKEDLIRIIHLILHRYHNSLKPTMEFKTNTK